MKIKEITEGHILFDNGNEITFDHYQECCEDNYADFDVIRNDVYINEDFEEKLTFKYVDEGFVFGDSTKKIFVPCYSEQNGWYTTDIDIYYNDEVVCSGEAVMIGEYCPNIDSILTDDYYLFRCEEEAKEAGYVFDEEREVWTKKEGN